LSEIGILEIIDDYLLSEIGIPDVGVVIP